MDRWIDRQMDKRWVDKKLDGQIYKQIDRWVDRWIDKQIDICVDCRQMSRDRYLKCEYKSHLAKFGFIRTFSTKNIKFFS